MSKLPQALCACALLAAVSVNAQKQSVILYNSVPINVNLTSDGDIAIFGNVVKDYMQGYELKPVAEIKGLDFQQIKFVSATKNAGYSILSAERILLNYKPNIATLDKSILTKLNLIAARLKTEPITRVLITGHYVSGNNLKVISNRVKSIKTYLKIKGVDLSKILVDKMESGVMENVVAVNYLK
ncbi:MAG: hypothetical protein V3V14_10610 [Saprospiraceae bacterium]